jgi:hypothetical protein
MCDKSKLSYYFTRKTEILLQQSSKTCVNGTVNTAIANTNETVVLGESDDITHCSSTLSILHDGSEIYESVVDEDLLSASKTDRCESLISLKIDSYK